METSCGLFHLRISSFHPHNTPPQAYTNLPKLTQGNFVIEEEMSDETATSPGGTCNRRMEISMPEASSKFLGYRFSPTDEELILDYLKKKLRESDESVALIPEVDICRHEPWDLPAQSVIQSDDEWLFFSPRGRKYPNGTQSKRSTESGYWKTTGKERDIKSGSNLVGTKQTLVFHTGRAPKGQRTEWILQEYATSEKSEEGMVVCRLRKNRDFHLNENPRSNSPGEKDLSMEHNNTQTLTGNEHSGGDKTSSSSNNSHSVEQIDTAYEPDDKATNEYLNLKNVCNDCADDDDCFADIMKDDIIELDDSMLIENVKPLRATAAKLKEAADVAVPFQGTANRRLRLGGQRVEYYQGEQTGTDELKTQDISSQDAHSEQINGRMIDKSCIGRMTVRSVLVFLVMLMLSLLLWLDVRSRGKKGFREWG